VIIPENPQMFPLSVLHVPFSVTYGIYEGNLVIVDPNLREERCIEGIVIVSANKFKEICYLHTYSSVKLDIDTVNE
jgi:exosome complex RNA-binding protein Rrp42 (RNase PH superfamily)